MSQLKPVSEAKTKSVFNVYAHEGMDLSSDPQVIALNARPQSDSIHGPGAASAELPSSGTIFRGSAALPRLQRTCATPSTLNTVRRNQLALPVNDTREEL